MRADEPPRPWGHPDFGAVAQRPRLLHLVKANPPGLCLLVAPSGYGKSVLAAQYLASGERGHAFWFDASRGERQPDWALRLVATELSILDGSASDCRLPVKALREDVDDLVAGCC